MDISKRVIARFCRYRNALMRFRQYGMKAIFSEELAQALGLTSAQVRKDFSIFKIPGKKKAGYRIDQLMKQFDRILDKTHVQHVVILGAGPMGLALVRDPFLTDRGVSVSAIFDEAKKISGLPAQIGDVAVLPISKLVAFVRSENIKYCVVAATDNSAQQMLDEAIISGIRGVLNFTPFELKVPKSCTINSVNLVAEIENLVFFTQQKADSPRHSG
jgi:redox-sensing transcriptional repressor